MPNNNDVNVASNGNAQSDNRRNCCLCVCVFLVLFLLLVIPISVSSPSISLVVNDFKGLTQNQTVNGFSPLFNFTVDVRRPRSSFAFRPVTYCYSHGNIMVFYKGFKIAKGEVEGYCAHKDGRQATMLFAWGKDVEMPDLIQNLLVEEARIGEAEVEVVLELPSSVRSTLWLCRAKTLKTKAFPCS
ncbi:hypothetical protein LUZ62_039933 [Rhynchospora pubera]|uniref:Uncharacterized protein n=1 Tax=Rhynchospora pubera TaxID=906938 RepID=A0AAV8FEJ3_9POAL|nr:hypothetical protein LUZ62_039933 [Rhynchospora pubera]